MKAVEKTGKAPMLEKVQISTDNTKAVPYLVLTLFYHKLVIDINGTVDPASLVGLVLCTQVKILFIKTDP